MSGDFYAIYPNGTKKWMIDIGGVESCPAIADDGTVYLCSTNHYFYAIDSNGTEKWNFCTWDLLYESPTIAPDGTIYFGNMGGRVFAINPNGTEKWHYDTGNWIISYPAIGDNGTIYIGSSDHYLYALNPNGTLKWRFKTGDWVKSHPTIADDGTIIFGSFDGNLYALNPDGTEKWRFGNPGSAANSVSIADDGTIYVGGDNLYALYSNGSLKWTFGLWDDNRCIGHSCPAISKDGTIYIGVRVGRPNMFAGEIFAINPDGTEQWRKRISHEQGIWSSPCIGSDGTVYIGSNFYGSRGFLHAFGPVTSNDPPSTPSISGETDGFIGEEYWYQFLTYDPDNNPISFYIDWGDGDEGWSIEWGSGEDVGFAHTWSEEGNYTIRAKAKDVLGLESDWGYLEVTMPVNQQVHSHPFLKLFKEKFPIIYQIIFKILNLKSI